MPPDWAISPRAQHTVQGGNASPGLSWIRGQTQGGSATPPGRHGAECCGSGGEALTSVECNWGEAQMETGAFGVILNFREPRRRSPWLCMNYSDMTGWPGGGGGGEGGPRALKALPTEARPLAPTSRLAQVTLTPALTHWRDGPQPRPGRARTRARAGQQLHGSPPHQRLTDFRPTAEHTQDDPSSHRPQQRERGHTSRQDGRYL